MSNRFQYQPRATENWEQRGEQKGGGFIGFLKESVQIFQAQKQNWIRMLPPGWLNPKHYGYDVWVHYSVGPQNASVLCELKMFNERCCVCEEYSRADAEGRDDAYDYKATRRVLVYLINRNEEKHNEEKPNEVPKPLAWASPWTLDRDISKLCKDRQTGELYQIDHPDVGYDIMFDREGELPNYKYVGIQIARKQTPVNPAYLDYILDNPLPNILIRRTYEEVKALFEGGTGAKDNAPAQPAQQTAAPPWQQPAQTQPEPVAQTQQTQTAPAPTVVDFPLCPNTVSFQGQNLGCAGPKGHPGNCEFTRMASPVSQPAAQPAPAAQPTLTQPPAGMFDTQPQPTQPAPAANAAAAPAGGSRADALRSRFQQR